MKNTLNKILITDNSEDSFRFMSEILKSVSDDVEFFHARDGESACKMIPEILPDLVIMDVITREVDGITAIKNLKAGTKTCEIPVIAVSSSESLEEAYEAGANDVILKPLKNIELLIRGRSVLGYQNAIFQYQKDILADVQYAERIQKAILPAEEAMENAFPRHFVLDLPCNSVSGDFYWLGEKDNKKILAVADCTGHGVSGAFMTLAGAAFLNQIMSQGMARETHEILIQLRQLIMKLLKQKSQHEEASAGMDISIVILDETQQTLQFSGANNPLYFIHDGELIVLKGDRMPIGIHLDFNQPFINQSLNITSGDMLYLFSDGYADQFGGPKNKKFRYRQFQELLLSIHKLPLNEQKERLNRTMDAWKGKNPQVDDILIVGIKI
ncbi:MAG: SpoIIE family protein phosphatase [Bacteroidales bacterium]|nr:SpoIIE family protein phosphatase [Bacteroidales bacterium]